MATQLVLMGFPKAKSKPERASYEAFQRFHRAHPEIYNAIVAKARQARANGLQKYGIGALWEIMRWEFAMKRSGDFKLNNNHRAWYARLIMFVEPDLKGFFEVREGKNHHARDNAD